VLTNATWLDLWLGTVGEADYESVERLLRKVFVWKRCIKELFAVLVNPISYSTTARVFSANAAFAVEVSVQDNAGFRVVDFLVDIAVD
jgi:hypothetical protein